MKTLMILVVLFAISLILSCDYEKSNEDKLPENIWVEKINRTDTMIFNIDEENGMLTVNRGFDIISGYKVPKPNSGIYEYTIIQDSIKMRNSVLDCAACFKMYYFKTYPSNSEFIIGNFLAIESSDPDQLAFVNNKPVD